MRLEASRIYSYFTPFFESVAQKMIVTVIKLEEIRTHPEAFQKTLIAIRSIFQGLNFYFRTDYFPHFIQVLTATETFDVYGVCRLPRYFLFLYTPDRLDEYALLDKLEVILCNNWKLGLPDAKGKMRDPLVCQFAKRHLTACLEEMAEHDHDLRTEEEMKQFLHQWFVKALKTTPEGTFDPALINLHDLSITLKKTSWLEILIDTTFISADIACIPAFLQEWSLLNLSQYANQLGRFRLLAWIPNQNLEDWIWGILGVGHLLQLSQAVHTLWQGKLTPAESREAKWLAAASIAESLYSFVMIQKRDPRLIVCCAFLAKSFGLVHFFLASKVTFFRNRPDVS